MRRFGLYAAVILCVCRLSASQAPLLGSSNVDSEALLAELARYEAEIANIESRFIRITDKLFYVQREDDAFGPTTRRATD
jgi:hypothetical protein